MGVLSKSVLKLKHIVSWPQQGFEELQVHIAFAGLDDEDMFFNGLSELNRRDALFACSLLAPRLPRARWADLSLQVSGEGSWRDRLGRAC